MELQNNQYDMLLSEYTRKQNRAKRNQALHFEQVSKAIPEFSELDASIGQLSVAAATAALNGDNSLMESLPSQIAKIEKQKVELLTKAGYPKDYLEPKYECPDCKDTGYIGNEKCHCLKRNIVDYLYSQSNIKHILDVENFNHFNCDLYPDDYVEESTGMTPRDNIRNILVTAREFVRDFDKKNGNLLLYGTTGVGKTFLSHCIAKELLDRSRTVVYLTSLELFDILEKYKFDRDQAAKAKSAQLAYILDCDLLIIDDLGTELTNNFVSSQLYQCIDSRLLRQRSTIISTNLSFDDLSKHYSERIFSRITSNYQLLKITGDDIRLKKAIQKI
jgi:DNA replication protein DnaC